jgi:hypothetical protein
MKQVSRQLAKSRALWSARARARAQKQAPQRGMGDNGGAGFVTLFLAPAVLMAGLVALSTMGGPRRRDR